MNYLGSIKKEAITSRDKARCITIQARKEKKVVGKNITNVVLCNRTSIFNAFYDIGQQKLTNFVFIWKEGGGGSFFSIYT